MRKDAKRRPAKELPMLHIVLHLLVPELSTNQPLESKDGVGRVDDGLTLGRQANETFAVFCEGDDGRCCSCTLGVLDDTGLLALHDGNT